MKVLIGSDHLGYDLKETLKNHLQSKEIEVIDVGTFDKNPVLYPEIGLKLAEKLIREDYSRGIIICGTGIGMAIAANKVPGVRAAVCHDIYSAERARKSNNAQVMTMGALVVGVELAKKLVDVWLESEFQGGGSIPKVEQINSIDEKYRSKVK